MNPFVFAIVASSCRSAFIKEHADLGNTTQKSVNGLPNNLECYTDAAELTNTIINPILSIIQEHSDLIEYIYVTDIHPEYLQ